MTSTECNSSQKKKKNCESEHNKPTLATKFLRRIRSSQIKAFASINQSRRKHLDFLFLHFVLLFYSLSKRSSVQIQGHIQSLGRFSNTNDMDPAPRLSGILLFLRLRGGAPCGTDYSDATRRSQSQSLCALPQPRVTHGMRCVAWPRSHHHHHHHQKTIRVRGSPLLGCLSAWVRLSKAHSL